MEYSDFSIPVEKAGMYCMELPVVCMPVYRDLVKEMAEQIEDERIRDVFYSLSLGESMQIISKRTRIPFKNLIYMYKKGSCLVRSGWRPSSEWKRELHRTYVKCRNYESLLSLPQDITGQNFRNVLIFVRAQDIPAECVDLLDTPLGKFGINFRILRALRKYNIYQLEDLLRFIKYNGFDSLYKIPGMGNKSVEQIYEKLKEKDILEDKDTCVLFRYLFI